MYSERKFFLKKNEKISQQQIFKQFKENESKKKSQS
jgi:hypothetical protein